MRALYLSLLFAISMRIDEYTASTQQPEEFKKKLQLKINLNLLKYLLKNAAAAGLLKVG